MIRAITVTNYLGDSIRLELARPELSGFVVRSITGLGPGKANINMTEVATNDGSLFNSSRISSRNIVISLKYLWKDSIEDVRQLSYKYFPLKKKCSLVIETDNRKVEIEGYVESNDPNIFSSNEESDISIICPFPFFCSVGENSINVTSFGGIEPTFEFPFANESLTEALLEFGSYQSVAEKNISYEGDADVGMNITIHAVGAAKNITIYNTKTREVMAINTDKLAALTGSGIVAKDDIIICTVKGRKSVRLIREGKEMNILNCLEKNPSWFQLSKGDNIFAYTAEEGTNNIQLRIENQVLFEGV